jgi:hypothetical protein
VGEGRRLTQAGNLRLGDGKALVGVLDTGDVIDPAVGGRTRITRSATDLGGVDLVFRVALQAGLVRRHRGQVVATRRGRELACQPLEAWRAGVTAVLDLGILTWQGGWLPWWFAHLEAGVGELLCTVHLGGSVEVADLAASALAALTEHCAHDLVRAVQLRSLPSGMHPGVRGLAARLEWLGVLDWHDAEVVDHAGGSARHGGRVTLTPLGSWFVRPLLAERGYVVPLVDD